VVVNYFVFKNTKQWDLTADQSNTLAKETQDVLKSLPETVVAKAFYSSNSTLASSKENTKAIFDQYVSVGAGKFQYEFIDPLKDPVAAQEAGITNDGSVILYMGSNKQALTSVSEQELTGAMIRLMNPGSHVVYFLTGHGEFPVDGSGDQSFTQLKSALTSKQKPLSENEVILLDAYIENGGSMVVMEEPMVVTQFGDSPDPLAMDLAQAYGIVLGNDIVYDDNAAQSIQQPFIAIANQYGQHAITEKMNEMVTYYPTARSVTTDDAFGTGYTKTELVMTADQSYAETDMVSIKDGTMKPDQGVDTLGPITIAVAAQGTSNNSRLVVFGDSDFASNAAYSNYGNGDMIVNSIDWAANVENIISLTPKNTVDRSLNPPKAYTLGLILLGSLVVLPGIVLAAGIGAWVARRRQG
jgi:ABC-type uncharacterized transport system involved in gliding motility auxiliary subunit